MLDKSQTVVIMQGSVDDLKRAEATLGEHDIVAAVVQPDEASGST